MALVTYPLNNIEYSAEDAELFHATRTSGVYAENSFGYSVSGNDNTIVIGTGIGWIKNSEFSGKVIALKEPISLDMGLPDSVYPRIDSVVIQFDANKNETNIVVKNGTAAVSPVAPAVVQTEFFYELHLYHVYRNAGDTIVLEDNVTDVRTNQKYCGLMTDSITNIDKTLTQDGAVADAKAVGDAIRELQYGSSRFFPVIYNESGAAYSSTEIALKAFEGKLPILIPLLLNDSGNSAYSGRYIPLYGIDGITGNCIFQYYVYDNEFDGFVVANFIVDSGKNVTQENTYTIPRIPEINASKDALMLTAASGVPAWVENPIAVTDDGYTDVSGLRRAVGIGVVQGDGVITVATTLEGGMVSTSEITLDDNGYPASIVTDGVACSLSWEGFDV